MAFTFFAVRSAELLNKCGHWLPLHAFIKKLLVRGRRIWPPAAGRWNVDFQSAQRRIFFWNCHSIRQMSLFFECFIVSTSFAFRSAKFLSKCDHWSLLLRNVWSVGCGFDRQPPVGGMQIFNPLDGGNFLLCLANTPGCSPSRPISI